MVSFRRLHFFHIVVFFTAKICCAQKPSPLLADSLSYDEIYSIYLTDPERYQNEVFYRHLNKAKRDKDSIQWAEAYRMRAWDMEISEGLGKIDTSIRILRNIRKIESEKLKDLMALNYLTKGVIYYYNDINSKAAEEFIRSFYLAREVGNHELIVTNLNIIADIKAFFGQENESLILAKKSLEYLIENSSSFSRYEESYLDCLAQLARSYLHVQEIDSSQKYIRKGLEIAEYLDHHNFFINLKILEAKSYFYSKKYTQAKDTLIKYSYEFKTLRDADDLYYLGMIEGKLGRPKLKRMYFNIFDSIMKIYHYPQSDKTVNVYQFLLKDAIENNNTQKEQAYFKRLVYYDSLLTDTQERLRKITLTQFDLPLEEEEKQVLNEAITTKQKILNILYVAAGLLLLGLLGYYLKYRETKKRLDYALTNTIKVEKPSQPDTTHLDVDKSNEEVLLKILNRLDSWETEKGFLDGSLSQQSLAKHLDTNTSYLSQTINLYKGQNFSTYLKDLRITYAINHLKENPGLVTNKSMIQLAELFGFSSTTVFTKAFKRKVGLTPGVFLKRLTG